MSIPTSPQVSCKIDWRYAMWVFIERLAIQRDSAKLAPRDSRDLRLDQPCVLVHWATLRASSLGKLSAGIGNPCLLVQTRTTGTAGHNNP